MNNWCIARNKHSIILLIINSHSKDERLWQVLSLCTLNFDYWFKKLMYLTLIVPYIIHTCDQIEGHQDFILTIHFFHILDFQKSKDIWIVHIIHTAVWNGLSATFQGSWDSIVSIVTRLWAAWCGFSIPAGARNLSFLQNLQWASDILRLGVRWPGLSTCLHLILRLRMIGTTSPLTQYAFMLYNVQLYRFMNIRFVCV